MGDPWWNVVEQIVGCGKVYTRSTVKVQVLVVLKRNKSLRIKATSQETVKRSRWNMSGLNTIFDTQPSTSVSKVKFLMKAFGRNMRVRVSSPTLSITLISKMRVAFCGVS